MRKFTLLLLCAGITLTANAQKNSVLLYGDFGGSMNTNDTKNINKDTRNMMDIAVGVGYQVSNHWTVGLSGMLSYESETQTHPPLGYSKSTYTTGYGGGVFGRYSHEITPLFYFYAQADAMYGGSTMHDDTYNVSTTGPGIFNLNVTPALGMEIKNGYGVDFAIGGIGYSYSNMSSTNTTTSGINYTFGRNFRFGLSKHFTHRVKKPIAKPIESQGGPEGE